jgi:hypothetical protein
MDEPFSQAVGQSLFEDRREAKTEGEDVTMKHPVILFGASGLLGSALLRERGGSREGQAKAEVLTIPWQEIPADETGFRRWAAGRLKPFAQNSDRCTVVIANGLTNPKLDPRLIQNANVEFPKALVEVLEDIRGFRLMTLGTIFENFPRACESNPYLRSKLELGDFVSRNAFTRQGAARFMHVRLHTVYGDKLAPHMFLGQMLEAIRSDKPFAMSSGEQMREYHHADDIAVALDGLIEREWGVAPLTPVQQLSSGEPVRLADLARAVFRAFGREPLLRIGAIDSALTDNRDNVFQRSPSWLLPRSRPPIEGVIAELKRALRA